MLNASLDVIIWRYRTSFHCLSNELAYLSMTKRPKNYDKVDFCGSFQKQTEVKLQWMLALKRGSSLH